jgi:hypothetical protein
VSTAGEARPLVQSRLLIRAVPAWAWVCVLVVVSAAIRFQLARRLAAPWIMVDELIYSELAKSIASGGHFLVRDQPTGAYGFVYPLLISPAYALFHAVPDAYSAAKAINAVVMSLAAVPAYLLARRVLPAWWALGAALIALALPGFVYTGTLMTENAFYPAFLGCVLVLVLCLERPTARRQVGLLALCALAFLVRTQAVALVPAVLLAPVVLDRIERRPWRELARFRVLYLVTLAGAVLAVAVQVARGRSLGELLGAYRAATDASYTVGGVAKWIVYHVAGLDLASGVVPFAALLLLLALARRLDRAARIFAVASASVAFWLVVEVGAFASQPSVLRIEERNVFYLVPLFAIALLVWIERGAPRPPVRAVAAAVVSAGLVAAIPFTTLIGPPAVSDTFALLPWWWLGDHVVDGSQLRLVAGLVAAAAVALLALPRRALYLLPLLLVAYFSVSTAVVLDGVHGVRDASVGSLWAGIKRTPRNWVDEAVPPGADVAAIWTGNVSPYTIWENEFFSRSVGRVYDLQGPLPGGLPETRISVDRSDGSVRLPGDGTLHARYVLVDGSFTPDGRVVARDRRQGVAVYETTGGIVRTSTFVGGLYPNDTWSGREATYRRLRCDGGTLAVTLASDPSLFSAPQHVVARSAGAVVGRATIPLRGRTTLRVPLRPGADGVCRVTFAVSPTAVPARVDPRSDDHRVLGAHFLAFDRSR